VLTMKLNHEANTWGLYLNGNLIRDDLPLFSKGSVPTISVTGGRVGDVARLVDLRLNGAHERTSEKAKDLRAEYENGNPNVRMFTPDPSRRPPTFKK
jgi:hypothetical protein